MPEQTTPLPTCPMAEVCKGMIEMPFSGFTLIIPGLLLIVLGVLVVIEPRILPWIMAAAFILIGIMLLMMARFIRRIGMQFQRVERIQQ